jgi:peptidyl-prolyl cis-trans isomerase-like 1
MLLHNRHPSTGGYLPDELTPALRHTGAGILSAANAGPGTNGSQFFFTLAPCPFLDGKHTVFARVSGGMGVLRRMAEVPTGDGDRPREDVTIIRAEVVTPCPGA